MSGMRRPDLLEDRHPLAAGRAVVETRGMVKPGKVWVVMPRSTKRAAVHGLASANAFAKPLGVVLRIVFIPSLPPPCFLHIMLPLMCDAGSDGCTVGAGGHGGFHARRLRFVAPAHGSNVTKAACGAWSPSQLRFGVH